ncbi:MAG: response regulator [Pseudomonadota bacterium]
MKVVMGIRAQIRLLLSIAVLVLPLVLGTAWFAARDTTGRIADMAAAEALIKSATELRLIAVESVLFHEARSEAQWHSKINTLQAELDRMHASSDSAAEVASIDRICKSVILAQTAYARLAFNSIAAMRLRASGVESSQEVRTIVSLLAITSEIMDISHDLSRNARADVTQALYRLQAAIVLVVLTLLLLMGVVWYLTRRRILQPLQLLEQGTQRVSSGEYSYRLNLPERNEIGQLADAFDAMAERVEKAQQDLLELNLELLSTSEQAQAASRAKGQFLANMSHELRTPMHAILGMLTLLCKTQLNVAQLDYAKKAKDAARLLLALLNEILDFSKIEAGKMTLDTHPFETEQMLRDLSLVISGSLGQKNLSVLFDIDPELPRVLVGDALRLRQVLVNLISNAIKFTDQGEVVISLSVVHQDGEMATLKIGVRDTGIGIAAENQVRIFSGFTQAESSITRRFGGTGLGLVISQYLVALMGGELALDSVLGEGSHFYFLITLPIATDDARASVEQARASTLPIRVLIVDANPVARDVLARMTQSLGWVVDVASSGEQALVLIQERAKQDVHYQALLIDWQVSERETWRIGQWLRALRDSCFDLNRAQHEQTLAIVMLTAYDREMLAEHGIAEHALIDGLLIKPLTAKMIFDALHEARSSKINMLGSVDLMSSTELPLNLLTNTASSSGRLSGMRLLIAEDNANNQQVARELLVSEGAVVQMVSNGQEAIEALLTLEEGQAAFDAILMDLQMPVMDGIAAATHIRNELGFLDIPIIAMTANAMASDRAACLAAGMNEHVAKPFDLNELVPLLHQQRRAFVSDEQRPQVPIHADDAGEAGSVLAKPLGDAAKMAGVDLETALTRLGGMHDIYQRALSTFMVDLESMPEQLSLLVAEQDAVSISRFLHTLKGLAATLGISKLAALAAETETNFLCLADKLSQPEPWDNSACVEINLVMTPLILEMSLSTPKLNFLCQAFQDAQIQGVTSIQSEAAHCFDRAELMLCLKNLVQHLSHSDMAAMASMRILQEQSPLADPLLKEALQKLSDRVFALDFVQALRCCDALMEEYGNEH